MAPVQRQEAKRGRILECEAYGMHCKKSSNKRHRSNLERTKRRSFHYLALEFE